MYDEGPLLPVYQQRKVFEFDPIGKVMFGNDDLKVSRGNIQQNCLVPQKNPDLESIIIDISEVNINGINKGVDEELFIQDTIVIENKKWIHTLSVLTTAHHCYYLLHNLNTIQL